MNNNQKKVLSLSLAVLLGTTSPLVLATRPALAQETQPGDVCSNAGWTRWVSTPTAGLLVCDGANWKSVIALENNGQSLLQVDNDTGSCTADKTGRLRFDGSSTWDYCDGTTWQGLLAGASGLWSDDTTHISYQSAYIIKSGQTLPAIMDDDGIRMFFYPDKAAFRGGTISGGDTAWQEANIGARSFTWGRNNTASGPDAIAIGDYNMASGGLRSSVAIGYSNTASGGHSSSAIGWANEASGSRSSVAIGALNTASGKYSIALGYNNTTSGQYGAALGSGNTVSGRYGSAALGTSNTVSGRYGSVAIGGEVDVGSGTDGDGTGNNSIGFGLQTNTSWDFANPKITGNGSAVFFFDNGVNDANENFVFASSGKFALVGGEFVLSETLVDGAAAGCLRFEPTGNKIEYSDDCTTYTALSDPGGLWSDDTSHISYQSAHIIKSGQTLPAALDDDGTRMFFYPDKAAFRGGTISGGNTAWQEANIGTGSFAWGDRNEASGADSTAFGEQNTATGTFGIAMGWLNNATGGRSAVAIGAHNDATDWYSTALGYNNTVSDRYATAVGANHTVSGRGGAAIGGGNTVSGDYYSAAIGFSNTVSGTYGSTAIGRSVIVGSGTAGDGTGDTSIGFGLQTNTSFANRPNITGDRSAVFFFDGGVLNANSGFDFTSSDKLALVGGEFVLSETQAQGAASGCIRFEPTGNKIEYSDDCTTYTALSDPGGLWSDDTTHISYQSAHIIKSGQTLPAALDDDGKRMFFYPDKGAFRGGTISGGNTAWQEANIGTNSFAWGQNSTASGSGSVAIGGTSYGGPIASGGGSIALGRASLASGTHSFATGLSEATSYGAVALGGYATATQRQAFAVGAGYATGRYGVAIGSWAVSSENGAIALGGTASGRYSSAITRWAYATGDSSFAVGDDVIAGDGLFVSGDEKQGSLNRDVGENSMAFGLQSQPQGSTFTMTGVPMVTGDRSAVFFFDGGVMDVNENFNFTGNDKFALVGGEFVLSETQVDGAASGCLRFEPTGNKIEYSDDCTTYTALSDISGLWSDDTTHISYQSAHIIKSGQTLPAALDDDGTRMFFYPDKAAFRGGTISGADDAWQDVNIGTRSFAWGDRSEASGLNSVAMGRINTASGEESVAIGDSNTASGRQGTAIGAFNTASSNYTVAIGGTNTASAWGAVALGYNNDATARSIAIGRYNDATVNRSTAIGYTNTASGNHSVAIGSNHNATGDKSLALGYFNTASGIASAVMGQSVMAGSGTAGDGAGDGSMAVGLQTASQTTRPKITGDRTIAFFFDGGVADANSAVDITASDAFIIHGGKVGIGDDTPDVELDVVGDINYTGVIQDVSDIRLKTDITPLAEQGDMLAQLEQVETYTFRMKDMVAQYGDDARYEYGVIAQNVETVFPELVGTDKDEAKTKSVNYMGFIAPLIEAVKKLSSKNRALEAEVQALKGRTVEPADKVPKPNRPAPESSDDPCTVGDMALDKVYLYFCTEEDTWKRWPLETW